MKRSLKTVIGCTASVVALSMFTSMAVLAEGDSDGIENSVWSYRAVANVDTQVNIRAYASTDSAIIGYLPKAGAADVIERGEEWSHVISNGVEGYIKNEYLAFGAEAKYLAEVYGTSGVKTNWDEVRVFSAPSAAAQILTTADAGQSYETIEDYGDWIAVQLDDSTMAYVPSEDVEKTLLLDKAIPVEGNTQLLGNQTVSSDAQAAVQQEDTADYGQTEGEGSTGQEQAAYMEDTASEASESDQVPNQESYTQESSGEAYTETQATEAPAAETQATEATAIEAAVQESATQSIPEESSEETVTSASADDVSLLAALIFCEAGNQSRDGKVAVGAVVMHRVASSSFANTIQGVIYQSGQFTPAYSGSLAAALAGGVPSDCYEAAQAALNGEDPVPGALYFNTGSGKGVKIGDHQFY